MIWLNPFALLGLIAVAGAAAAALWRPRPRVVAVSSLRLWRRALELAGVEGRRQRRIGISWILLLAGAVAAVLAAGRPVVIVDRPRRMVALALYPGAELANSPGIEELKGAGHALLGRLGADDRVMLLRPVELGGATGWLTVDEVTARVGEVETLVVSAQRLTVPRAGDEAQHVYHIYPAGMELPEGPGNSNVVVGTTVPVVTLDGLAAEMVAEGEVEVFVAVRNHLPEARVVEVEMEAAGETRRLEVAAEGGGRASAVVRISGEAERIEVRAGGRLVGQRGELEREEARPMRMAMLGRDDPHLRRFVEAMPGAVMAADAEGADVVIAVGVMPEGDEPGLVFDTDRAPVGWSLAEREVGPVLLGEADLMAGAGLLGEVDVSGVAVRRARPMVAGATAAGRRLVSVPEGVLVLETDDPRRVYVGFDPSAENTNWVRQESYVVFLAEALTWASGAEAEGRWRLTEETEGQIGMVRAEGAGPAIEDLHLPQARLAGARRELWPMLAAAAGMLWMAGWWFEARGRKIRSV